MKCNRQFPDCPKTGTDENCKTCPYKYKSESDSCIKSKKERREDWDKPDEEKSDDENLKENLKELRGEK